MIELCVLEYCLLTVCLACQRELPAWGPGIDQSHEYSSADSSVMLCIVINDNAESMNIRAPILRPTLPRHRVTLWTCGGSWAAGEMNE
jgi:hypothetical protein